MSNEKQDPLSPSEWKVMKIVWEKKSVAFREIYEQASKEQDWSQSTVKTLLRRLVDKGYVETQAVGNSYLYKPALSPQKPLRRYADDLLNYAMDGTVGPLLAYMVKKSDLNPEEVHALRKMLDEYEDKKEDKS